MFIENEAAYEAAIDRNIRENRRKGGEKRFRAAFEDAQAIIDFVEARVSDAQVEFYAKWGRALEDASFIDACYAGLKTFGGLTEKQALAVRNIIAKNAERKSAYRAEALTKVHVGTVGERREFTLTVVHVHAFEGQFGYVFINILNDAEGDRQGTRRARRREADHHRPPLTKVRGPEKTSCTNQKDRYCQYQTRPKETNMTDHIADRYARIHAEYNAIKKLYEAAKAEALDACLDAAGEGRQGRGS